MRARFLLLCLGVILAGLAVAAGGEVSFKRDVQPILDDRCVDCHGGKRPKAGLDLSPAKAYAALIGVPSRQVPSKVLVKPGDLEASVLWLKLTHRAEAGTGMPKGFFGAKKLPEKDLETIRAWIQGGAKE